MCERWFSQHKATGTTCNNLQYVCVALAASLTLLLPSLKQHNAEAGTVVARGSLPLVLCLQENRFT